MASGALNSCLYSVSDAVVKISLVCFGVGVGGLEEAALEGGGVAALEVGELVALEDAEVLEDLGAMLSGVELGMFMRVVLFLWLQCLTGDVLYAQESARVRESQCPSHLDSITHTPRSNTWSSSVVALGKIDERP